MLVLTEIEIQEMICNLEEKHPEAPVLVDLYKSHQARDKRLFESMGNPYRNEEYFDWPNIWTKLRGMQTFDNSPKVLSGIADTSDITIKDA